MDYSATCSSVDSLCRIRELESPVSPTRDIAHEGPRGRSAGGRREDGGAWPASSAGVREASSAGVRERERGERGDERGEMTGADPPSHVDVPQVGPVGPAGLGTELARSRRGKSSGLEGGVWGKGRCAKAKAKKIR